MEPDSGSVLKEPCRECDGSGTKLSFTLEGAQQVELCKICHGKGQVYADVDRTITRLADQAIMRLIGRGRGL
jgi:DnaJ-class molecular chaperone